MTTTFPTNLIKKGLIYTGVAVATAAIGLSSYIYVDSGEFARVQSPNGYTWYTEAGMHFKWPFVSKTTIYSQNVTMSITDDLALAQSASLSSSPLRVTFADTYSGTFEATYRFVLPKIPENLEKNASSR